jgi:hypothetical protein
LAEPSFALLQSFVALAAETARSIRLVGPTWVEVAGAGPPALAGLQQWDRVDFEDPSAPTDAANSELQCLIRETRQLPVGVDKRKREVDDNGGRDEDVEGGGGRVPEMAVPDRSRADEKAGGNAGDASDRVCRGEYIRGILAMLRLS